MRSFRWIAVLGLLLISVRAAAEPSAALIHFTDDGSATGKSLLPGFRHHSVWSAIGAASNGQIYIAVSNHQQPGGNAAIYRLDPLTARMHLLGDLTSVSLDAGNWMVRESQHKVHTFLLEHADGLVHFFSDDYPPTPFLRGAHHYAIDPSTNTVLDLSDREPQLMGVDLQPLANTHRAAERSGVFIETFGIKGMGLNRAAPDTLYAMTWPDGHLVHQDLKTGSLKVVGRSEKVSYVFYTDRQGNAWYTSEEGGKQVLLKYVLATGETKVIADDLPTGELGAMAPNADESEVWLLMAGTKEVYVLEPARDRVTRFGVACGTNQWRLYNMSLAPDGRFLYFVSNNNPDKKKLWQMDTSRGVCSEVLDLNGRLGSRNLAFGGVNVWDREGNLYVPVWTHEAGFPDVAVLRLSLR